MKYYNVVKDIIKYYSNVVNNYELDTLKRIEIIIKNKKDLDVSDEIIFFINRILDRIWNLTLTDINEFKNGEDFCFLIKNIEPVPVENNKNIIGSKLEEKRVLSSFNIENIKIDMIDNNVNNFELINHNNIINKDLSNYGIIISINYTNNIRTIPLLPIYFNKTLRVNLNYNVLASYAIDTNLERIDSSLDASKEFSENNKIPMVLINKMLYRENNNEDFISFNDFNDLIIIFIEKYINELNKKELIGYESDLINFMDKKNIKVQFIKYYNNLINKEELKKIMYEIIENATKDLTLRRKK